MNRASDWYNDFVKVPTLWNAVPKTIIIKFIMFGLTAVPYIGDLARKVANLYLLVPLAILQQHLDLDQQRTL